MSQAAKDKEATYAQRGNILRTASGLTSTQHPDFNIYILTTLRSITVNAGTTRDRKRRNKVVEWEKTLTEL